MIIGVNIKYTVLLLLTIFIVLISGCQKEFVDQEIYQRPDWLEGKLFTQIQQQEDLNMFIECLQRTSYDTVINVSGSFTVFAPTDQAFERYFNEHPVYDSVSQIPLEELNRLVQYQIIQNAWSKAQFRSLDIYGWIDKDAEFYNEPRGYKRETLLREENRTYYVTYSFQEGFNIVDYSNQKKKAYTHSRKFVPIFFNEYFDINDLNFNDYEFYFNRSFESGEIFIGGAKIVSDEIFAENGFVYKTDRVNDPLLNAEELMEKDLDEHSYTQFLSLIHEFPDFNFNATATYEQGEFRQGLTADSLFDLSYPELIVNIHDEITRYNVTSSIRYHNGMLAPTNEAFERFLDEYIRGPGRWGDLKAVPSAIKIMIVNSHMTDHPVYKTNLSEGFRNGEEDIVILDESQIVQSTYGSNCTFLGLNKTIIPKAFLSVAQPAYLNPGYSTILHAIEKTKIISALKRLNTNYSFYIPADYNIGYGGDSSLIYKIDDLRLGLSHFETYDRSLLQFSRLSIDYIRGMLLNHIGISIPMGNAKKEFIRTLGGFYIVVNNNDGTIRGDANNTYGFNGDSVVTVKPELIDVHIENGKTYHINTWLTFTSGGNFFGIISSLFPDFFDLMKKAGLYDEVFFKFRFLTEGNFYTVFIPSKNAIINNKLASLPKEDLAQLIKYHFVKDELIFTDGKLPAKKYITTRLDESSTVFLNIFSTIDIRPGYDEIDILDKNGALYYKIEEGTEPTNILVKTDTDPNSQSNWDFITSGVIHVIDTVLIKDKLQAK